MLVRPPNDGCQHDNADLVNVLLEARPQLAVDSPARTGCRLDSRLLLNPQESTLSCRKVVWRGYEQLRGSLRAGRLNLSQILCDPADNSDSVCALSRLLDKTDQSVCILISLSTGTKAVPTVWHLWSSCWLEGQVECSSEQPWGSLRAGMLNLSLNFCPFSLHLFYLLDWRQLVCILISLSTGNKNCPNSLTTLVFLLTGRPGRIFSRKTRTLLLCLMRWMERRLTIKTTSLDSLLTGKKTVPTD